MSTAQSTVTYRDIPEFPGYRVGDDGSVWSKRGQLKSRINRKTGRYQVSIRKDKVPVTLPVHKLVLTAFAGARPSGMECRHLDGDRLNNRLSNLSWGTKEQNTEDRRLHGNTGIGEKNPSVKLTEQQVIAIIVRRKAGERGVDLAKEYGVSPSAICLINKNKKWKHIL